jgi:hypothetical protein
MKTSTTLLFSVASLAACHTMTAPVEEDVQVGQAMYSRYIASVDRRECTVEDHLEAILTGVYRDCSFCQVRTSDAVVSAVNDAIRKGPIPGSEEPIFTYGTLPTNNVETILIDSRGRKIVFYDFFARDFDGNLHQTQKFDKDYNVLWSLSDETSSIKDFMSIEETCIRVISDFQSG